ncbi:SCP domain-containing protein [Meloidogyne graminicola]|uniref:SCP domain-containing protein n=1 Tax=Meloidogyne graminicola TaxID=189291 RepID=A0A8S9ZWZ0_9BILA|nr:SCP domain-containing protein [Meloidogyne graminicola]
MPEAKKMKQMSYSIELEQNAQKWVNKCTCEHSGISGESFYCFPQRLNESYAIMQAIIGWNAELEARGAIGPISKYGETCIPFEGNYERGIGHWMQIVWSETTQVGCAVAQCYTRTNVFCQYKPAGNIQRGCIYWEGEPCSECEYNCNRTTNLCLN